MGRYFANGLLTTFSIKKRKSGFIDRNFDLKQELDNILKDIGRIIDPELYEMIDQTEEEYIFSLKTTIVDEHFQELIKELSSLTRPNTYGFVSPREGNTEDVKSMTTCPVHASRNQEESYIIEGAGYTKVEDYQYFPFYWLIKDERIFRNITVTGSTIVIWMDHYKYCGEDESGILEVVNELKVKYYQSKLAKALIYYIPE